MSYENANTQTIESEDLNAPSSKGIKGGSSSQSKRAVVLKSSVNQG